MAVANIFLGSGKYISKQIVNHIAELNKGLAP